MIQMSTVRVKKFHTIELKKIVFYGKIINSKRWKNFKTSFKNLN
jgi:hypothetical protein